MFYPSSGRDWGSGRDEANPGCHLQSVQVATDCRLLLIRRWTDRLRAAFQSYCVIDRLMRCSEGLSAGGSRLAVAKFIVPDWGGEWSQPYTGVNYTPNRGLWILLLDCTKYLTQNWYSICMTNYMFWYLLLIESEKTLSSQTIFGAAQYYSVVDFYVFFLCV